MKYIGYIINKNRNKETYDFIKLIKDYSEVTEDLPCIIVGLSEAKSIASDKFSILRKQINDKLFWTFGRTEKRNEYENDIKEFYNLILDNKFKNIKYYYIDFLNINFNIKKRLIKLCYSSKKKYIYIWNDMVYILCDEDKVIGFSLKILKYCKFKVEKIISRLESNKNNIITYNNNFLNDILKHKTKNKQYIVPYIMSLMEYKNV